MKGFLYIADEISGNPKDQIGFVDRVLQHGDNVFRMRGRTIVSSGLSDALSKVREQGSELVRWSKPNEETTIFVALGYQEALGGGSRTWFGLQYKALIQELKALGFSVCCVLPDYEYHDTKKLDSARRWTSTATGIVDKVSRSMKVDIVESPLTHVQNGGGGRASSSLIPCISSIEDLAACVSRAMAPQDDQRKRVRYVVQEVPKETQSASKALPKKAPPRRNPFEGALGIRRAASRVTGRAKRQREAIAEVTPIVPPPNKKKAPEVVSKPPPVAPEVVALESKPDPVIVKPKRKKKKRIFIA